MEDKLNVTKDKANANDSSNGYSKEQKKQEEQNQLLEKRNDSDLKIGNKKIDGPNRPST